MSSLNLKYFCHLREKPYIHQQSPVCCFLPLTTRFFFFFFHSRSCVLDSSCDRSHILCGLSLLAGSYPALWLNETHCMGGSVGCLILIYAPFYLPGHLLMKVYLTYYEQCCHEHPWTPFCVDRCFFTSLGHVLWSALAGDKFSMSPGWPPTPYLCSGG